MIKMPVLEEKELNIYKGKKVLLYGTHHYPSALHQALTNVGIDIIGGYIENIEMKVYLNAILHGYRIFKKNHLYSVVKGSSNIIMQGFGDTFEKEQVAKERARELDIEYSELPSGAIINSFSGEVNFDKFRNPFFYHLRKNRWKKSNNRKLNKTINEAIIICSPPKTADYTLNSTFSSPGVNIQYFNTFHRTKMININQSKIIKVIMGVREPITQNLSVFFHQLSAGIPMDKWIIGYIYDKSVYQRKKILEKYEKEFNGHHGDVQFLWDEYINRFIYQVNGGIANNQPLGIQDFIRDFRTDIFDIIKYPFNNQKGYSIVKEENVEVFVYQLEKLNDIVPEMSDWIGVPFDKLEKANVGEDKWISDVYRQALQEIEISQEYFDRCYEELYVKHFYSEEDIEKFKARWRPHIKKE